MDSHDASRRAPLVRGFVACGPVFGRMHCVDVFINRGFRVFIRVRTRRVLQGRMSGPGMGKKIELTPGSKAYYCSAKGDPFWGGEHFGLGLAVRSGNRRKAIRLF